MPIYKYKAIGAAGNTTEGTYTARDRDEVVSMLRGNKYYPLSVDEVIEKKDIVAFDTFKRVKTKDIAVFCRQFYTMLNAGVTVISCLDILRLQTENGKLRKAVASVYDEVQKGLTLSEALRKYNDVFPELLVNMVEAGEVSGTLDTIMDRMATHFEKENRINNKVRSALVYPAVISVIAVVVVIFLLVFVMPTFVGMFDGTGIELPLPTRVLLGFSTLLKKLWYVALSALLLVVFLVRSYLKTSAGKLTVDAVKLKLPIVRGTTRKVITSRFTRTLSTLLKSGIPLLQALEVAARVVGNRIAAEGILRAQEEVRKGVELAAPLKDMGLFPPMVYSMVKIGEESGALDDILEKTASFYDEEVETSIQRMTTLLEPLMLIVMALVVGTIIASIILPMFSMASTVSM